MLIYCFLYSILIRFVENTDIGVIYKNNLLLLQNADKIDFDHQEDNIYDEINLSDTLTYPVGLGYEPKLGTFFVADVNNRKTDIFIISIKNKTINMHPLISKYSQSSIDSITYDPLNQELFWTDSFKHTIFSSNVSSSALPFDQRSRTTVISNRKVYKPRGITLNYCNRNLFWTERDEKIPTIEKCDLYNKKLEVLNEAQNNSYFQGINYNAFTNELIWAETLGDDEKASSCKIIAKSMNTGEEHTIGNFNDCYPFSLTSDKDNIYWSDWSRQGVMKLSRKSINNSLIKLISTPPITTNAGFHNGAFGIVHTSNIYCNYSDHEDENTGEHKKIPLLHSTHNSLSSFQADLFNEIKHTHLHLVLTIIGLSFGCMFFFITTLVLFCQNIVAKNEKYDSFKNFIVFCFKRKKLVGNQKKLHRKFRPKPGNFKQPFCGSNDDGVRIDIEDCCQMTLCDTPCYVNEKREGTAGSIKSKLAEDKLNLLQNCQDI